MMMNTKLGFPFSVAFSGAHELKKYNEQSRITETKLLTSAIGFLPREWLDFIIVFYHYFVMQANTHLTINIQIITLFPSQPFMNPPFP